MEYSENRFLLDVHDITSRTTVDIKQGETGRKLVITLKDRGSVFPISPDCHAVFTARKPDGKIIFNDCEINGNEIEYKMTPQTVAAAGNMACEIRLYGADNLLLVSALFTTLVSPAVYNDGDIIESQNEVNTLTALISEASTKLANGDFVPKVTVGTVTTLPAGSMAKVEITGTAENPVLNFAIPMGEQGQAEGLIPDAELSANSTKPVQNKVITEAINTLEQNIAEATDALTAAIEKVDSDNTESINALAEEVGTKVDKVTGKGLSTNDYTDAEKQKLSGIAEGANKYVLPVGGSALGGVMDGGNMDIDDNGVMWIKGNAVGTSKIADAAVTRAKLAQDALYSPFVTVEANTTIGSGHIGKKLRLSKGDTDYVINVQKDSTIPEGSEIGIYKHFARTGKIIFASNIKVALKGESAYLTAPTVSIVDTFTTIAIEKLGADSNYDYWHIIGDVEVV